MNNSIFERLAVSSLEQGLWYFLWTVPFFLIFWVIGRTYFANRRIQPTQRANARQYIDEIRLSLMFVLMYAVADVFLLHASSGDPDTSHSFKIYQDIQQHGGWPYAVFTCFVLFVIDDTWFYWMHRAIHHPRLYRYVHKVHHESIDTTPFTAYRFHPVEGLLEMGSAVLVIAYVALVPVHIGAIVAWQVGAIAFNVIAHMGYEMYPVWWNNYWLLKWKTTSMHHNMHHERFEGNYGLYFRWWDRLMKTEVEDYETTYRALFTRQQRPVENLTNAPTANEAVVTQARLTVDGLVRSVTVLPTETILDAALRQGVPVPFSCRKGRCGTCQAMCTNGAVTLAETQTFLSAEAIQQGRVLLCQSTTRSERVDLFVS